MKSSEEKKILHAKMILQEMKLERRKKAEIITKNQKVISFFFSFMRFFFRISPSGGWSLNIT